MSDVGVIVTGVLVGSASGIGGALLGAWVNGRSQMASLRLTISAENERQRIAEKRRIYARCMATSSVLTSAMFMERAARVGGTNDDFDVAFRALKEAREANAAAFAELELIAPDAVADAADDLDEACDQYMDHPAPRGEEFLSEAFNDVPGDLGGLARVLYDAMRIDLGEPPFSPRPTDTEHEPDPA